MGKSGLDTFIGVLLIGALIIVGIANYKKQKKELLVIIKILY